MTPTPTTGRLSHYPPEVRTMADAHAQLMRGVVRRVAPVLALLEARTAWPHAELGTLTNFLSIVVLRQVSDEEAQLYPREAAAPPFAELSADHARLRALTADLERAYLRPCSSTRLSALVDELLSTLHRHLAAEQRALTAIAADADADADGRRARGPVSAVA